tara:strand:+ start:554 stop:1090 length:537 start_codon:yes stop_codon:yes gene_type:complete
MNKKKIIVIHIVTFVLLSLLLLFMSEPLLNKFAAGIHNVGMWIDLMIYGTIGILILTTISCLIFLKKGKKKARIEKIELTKNGFLINYDGEITQYHWTEIEKLTGFLFGRITYDDVCLQIESENKTSVISEEFDGWRMFMTELYKRIPELDEEWERIMYNPPFERKETILYNRNKNVL